MPRLFALNQNFPLPIVDSVHEWLAADADLVPIVDVHSGMATLEDWEVLLALHADKRAWDGLITTDSSMLNLPRELAVLCQTKLTLVVAVAAGHDPIKATGLVFAHISNICSRTGPDTAPAHLGLRDPAELPASEGGWILLGKREQEEIALGLVGKFWRSVIEYVELGASGLKALAEPGYAKTVYGLAVSPIRRASNAAQGRDADRDH
jgi:hypothetical protein